MKYTLFALALLLTSCATNPKGFSKLFDAQTGNEIRPTSPWKGGISEVRFTNSTKEIVSIRRAGELLLIGAESSMKFEVAAGEKLTINEIEINMPLLGRNRYNIEYFETD